MKNHVILALLLLSLSCKIAVAQTRKPATTTTKKPTTTVKSSPPKTTSKTTKTNVLPTITQPVDKKKTTTVTSPPSQVNTSTSTPSSTTTVQSSGPSKTKTPEPEKIESIKEENPEKVRIPKFGSENESRIRFGVRAEATQLYTLESGGDYDLLPGVNAGLIVNLPINNVVSIQPEILYSMITDKVTENVDNYAKSTTNGILIPLMFNFNFGNGSTKFMLNLGGYGNYTINQTSKVVVGGETIFDGSVNLGNDKFDYGAGLGLGVKLNNSLMIEARSFYSLKDNINKNGIGTIGIGYLF